MSEEQPHPTRSVKNYVWLFVALWIFAATTLAQPLYPMAGHWSVGVVIVVSFGALSLAITIALYLYWHLVRPLAARLWYLALQKVVLGIAMAILIAPPLAMVGYALAYASEWLQYGRAEMPSLSTYFVELSMGDWVGAQKIVHVAWTAPILLPLLASWLVAWGGAILMASIYVELEGELEKLKPPPTKPAPSA